MKKIKVVKKYSKEWTESNNFVGIHANFALLNNGNCIKYYSLSFPLCMTYNDHALRSLESRNYDTYCEALRQAKAFIRAYWDFYHDHNDIFICDINSKDKAEDFKKNHLLRMHI